MSSAEFIIAGLLALLIYLMAMRLKLNWQKDNGAVIGSCMTIGSRELQEDAAGYAENKNGVMLVLADGMGREYGGRISVNIVIDVFCKLFQETAVLEKPQYFFRQTFAAANRKILETLDDQRGGASVGAVIVQESRFFYALAGNVCIAVYRDGDLIAVSEGHTIDVLAKNEWRHGRITRDEALRVLKRRRLYNYIGQDGFSDIEFFSEPIKLIKGDIVVLMSDGVYEFLRWRDIEDILAKEITAQAMALEIIELVNKSDKGDKDNASIILLRN